MRALAATVSHGSPTSCYRVGGQGHLFPLPSRGARALNKRLKSLPFLSPPLLPASSFLPRCIPLWPASLHAFLPWRGLPGAGEKGTLELRLLAWCPAWTACPKGDPGASGAWGRETFPLHHCIQSGFGSVMVVLVGRLHPQHPLTASWQHTHQTSVIFPKILPKFEVGATGRCRA